MTLVLVTAIGAIVAIMAISMIDLGYRARILALRTVDRASARAAADAGVADAVFWMRQKLIREVHWEEAGLFPRTVTTTLPGTKAACTYTITVVEPRHSFQIDATGSVGNQSRTVHEIIHVGSLWKGVGVLTSFDAKNGATFQGDGEIRTNSTKASEGQITLKNGVIIPGDIIIGPGGDIDSVLSMKAGTIVKGEITVADEKLVFPPVAAPTPALNLPALTKSEKISTPGTYQYPSIQLPNGAQLLIAAPDVKIYVAGSMEMKNGAEVVVQAGASLELYLRGALEGKNSAGFSNGTNDPGALRIYGLPTCTSIEFKAKSNVYAALYAPAAAITLYNGAIFHGAVCATSLEIKNSGVFAYDDRVRAVLIDDMAAVFETQRWWED